MTTHLTRRGVIGGACASTLTLGMPRRGMAQRYDAVVASAQSLDQLHSLVVQRAGNIEFAQAFRGPSLEGAANIKSVSKTILALLTGIAIDRGFIRGPEQQVLPLGRHGGFGDARDALTYADLLSMRGGLESTSGANYGAWVSSADWVGFALSRDLVAQPGGRFIYSTGTWHILGAAVSQACDMSLLEMTRRWIGDPMGLRIPAWVRDPQGYFLGGNDMAMRPADLARIGTMVLAGGRFGDVRIVSEDWITTSLIPRARSPWSGDAYGYGWFLTRFGGHDAAYGRGYGGQILAIVPGLDLSIAITSDPTRPARSGGYFSDLRGLIEQIVRA